MTLSRITDGANGAIEVTLASGSTLQLANQSDVEQVRARLNELEASGHVRLFRPKGLVVNLDQVTNIRKDAGSLTIWGTDGHSPMLSQPTVAAIWPSLHTPVASAGFIEVTPSLLVNPRHVSHVSMVDGKLRFFLSNKSWPLIEAAADISAAKKGTRRNDQPRISSLG